MLIKCFQANYLSGVDVFKKETWIALISEVHQILKVFEDYNILREHRVHTHTCTHILVWCHWKHTHVKKNVGVCYVKAINSMLPPCSLVTQTVLG